MMGEPVTFKLEGVMEMLEDFEDLDKRVKARVRATLQRELESWVVDAKLLTPVDTGALQQSGRLEKPMGNEISYEIWFGNVVREGKFVDYAEEVHENHPTHSKFLERVVDARSPQLEEILANDIEGVL